ncbi:DUF1697 domain-containing protein [Nocardiopsis potens]|uniref:DUF1697 domain-containing protein n=1 Tax=Nocardiopsis potens TaxID=1246458 RepID=UPI00034DF942|nr:DUF1697 domain-containing protein [Nocardiopsis potens]
MTRWIALLRGVNVGGRRKVPMAELREVVAGLGHTGVATLLQSGNVAFTERHRTRRPGSGGEEELRTELEAALAERFGFAVDTVLRDAAGMRAAVQANPLPVGDPSRFLVLFLRGEPDAAALAAVDAAAYAPEAMAAGAREVYFDLPDGLGRAKLPDAAARALGGAVATGRNWRTVLRLLEMAEE